MHIRGGEGLIFRIASKKKNVLLRVHHSGHQLPDLYEVQKVQLDFFKNEIIPSNGVRVGRSGVQTIGEFFVSPTLKVTDWSSCLKVISSPCTSIKALAVLKNGLPKINGDYSGRGIIVKLPQKSAGKVEGSNFTKNIFSDMTGGREWKSIGRPLEYHLSFGQSLEIKLFKN
ncbi:hypothetical protein Tco_0178620 [Tanacetum coccineum]